MTCSPLAFTIAILYPIIETSACIAIIFFIYKVLKSHQNQKNELIKPVLCLYIDALLYFLFRIPYDIFACVDKTSPFYTLPYILVQVFQTINWYCLIWVLYKRLLFVFKDSVYSVTQKTKRVFKIVFIAPMVIVIISAALWSLSIINALMFNLSGILLVLSWIIQSIWLIVLFGNKLKKLLKELNNLDINNTNKQLNEEITNVTTRYFILCTISLTMSILVLFGFAGIIAVGAEGEAVSLLTFTAMLDIFTNVSCTYLQSKTADKLYYKLCDGMDRCCKRICDKRRNERKLSTSMVKVASLSPVVSASTVSTPSPTSDPESVL